MTRLLDVRYNAEKAGVLSRDDAGTLGFAYDRDYIGGPEPRAISFSMPLREEHFADRVVRPFFSGLLPDEGARQRLAGALGISAGNAFGLLEVIGGECAGALSLHPIGAEPQESRSQKRAIQLPVSVSAIPTGSPASASLAKTRSPCHLILRGGRARRTAACDLHHKAQHLESGGGPQR